jgi:hypothetical protein
VKKLKKEQDNWPVENAMVKALEPYAAYIPENLLSDYVSALTMTYVGYMGSSIQYRRTDFYADGAAPRIPGMFRAFDDKAAAAFVETVRTNSELKKRVREPEKMRRLRRLGSIVLEKVSKQFPDIGILEALSDAAQEKKFISLRDKRKSE